jgi:hypothetical protein
MHFRHIQVFCPDRLCGSRARSSTSRYHVFVLAHPGVLHMQHVSWCLIFGLLSF